MRPKAAARRWSASTTAVRERRTDFEARKVVDAGFLELVRYGVRRADDPVIVDSLKVIDHVLKVETPDGAMLEALQPRWLWTAARRRAVPGLGAGACLAAVDWRARAL